MSQDPSSTPSLEEVAELYAKTQALLQEICKSIRRDLPDIPAVMLAGVLVATGLQISEGEIGGEATLAHFTAMLLALEEHNKNPTHKETLQ